MEDLLNIKEEFTASSILCRLCLIQNSSYFEVFEDDASSEIAETLTNLIGIPINPLDNWPKSICMGCFQKIHDFQTLAVKARENEFRLSEVFGEYKPEVQLPQKSPPVHVKLEENEGEIKEEDSEGISDRGESPDQAIKEESDGEASAPSGASEIPEKRITRSRISRKKVQRKRGRKRKASLEEKEEDMDEEENQSEVPEVDEDGRKRKDARRLRDEKIDEEIHAFFKMECVLCNIPFPRFADVQVHFRKEHKRRGYVVCCGKKLLRPMKLYEHMQDHVNPTKHQCSICQKYYKSDQGLRVHKKLQHTPPELRKFRCDKCPQSFALISALTAHMISHMAPEEKTHKCDACGQAFALKTILVQHVRRVHENACVKVCEICAKVFRSKDTFEKHMGEHMNVQPNVPCTICGKLFKHRLAMQRHRYRHNTSGSLECPICQRVAANRQALHEHIKHNHRERKTFQCSICERIFKSRVSLKEHMASHTGQVLYQCLFCPKQFNSNANYFRHNKMSHPVEWEAEKEKRRAERINAEMKDK